MLLRFGPCSAAAPLVCLLCTRPLMNHCAFLTATPYPPPPRRRTVLPRMGWPPAAQEQLVFHITQSDPKQLKDFLKAALQQARSGAAPGQ